jgi:MFS family permease
MIGPLVPYLLVQYGGGASESGWFQALNNLLTNIGQVLWGRIGDICKFRKTLLTLGAASSIIMPLVVLAVLSIFGSINPHTIIVASALASFLGSASAPVLAPIVSDIAGEVRRTAEILAALSNFSTAFSLIGGISAASLLQILTNTMLGYITLSATALMLSLTAVIFTMLVPRAVTESGSCKPFTRLGVAQEFKSFGADIKGLSPTQGFEGSS